MVVTKSQARGRAGGGAGRGGRGGARGSPRGRGAGAVTPPAPRIVGVRAFGALRCRFNG